MEHFQMVELARGLPEDVWVFVKELRSALREVRTYSRKVTGVGSWGILTLLAAVVAGTVMTHVTAGLVVPTLATAEVRLNAFFFIWCILYGALFYCIGYAFGKARFGGKLNHARAQLEIMCYSSRQNQDIFFCALSFLNKCEPGLMGFVSKKIAADFKARLASLTALQESA